MNFHITYCIKTQHHSNMSRIQRHRFHEETHKGKNLFLFGCQSSFNFCTSEILSTESIEATTSFLQATTCREHRIFVSLAPTRFPTPTPCVFQHQLDGSTHFLMYKHWLSHRRLMSSLAPLDHPDSLAATRRKLQLPMFKHQLEPQGQLSSLAPPYHPC